jgi:23S rRNA (cytidine1920-2'-O)/16S rRNA (cytidine1409-2'-O)-methyltransferase
MKKRIDVLLVERGLAESRQKAQALLLAGQVLAGEQKVEKAGQLVDVGITIRLLGTLAFASRAGAKLQAALVHFRIPVEGRVCADFGASTGGFTDGLLQCGARKVHTFDVGRGLLDWRLRSDARVIVHDQYNVRNIAARDLPADISLLSVDLSFISLTKILVPLEAALRDLRRTCAVDLVLLVKPQFEVGKGEVGKGGIVRDPAKRAEALRKVEEFATRLGFHSLGSIDSPVAGSKGNVEFLLYLRFDPVLSSVT